MNLFTDIRYLLKYFNINKPGLNKYAKDTEPLFINYLPRCTYHLLYKQLMVYIVQKFKWQNFSGLKLDAKKCNGEIK